MADTVTDSSGFMQQRIKRRKNFSDDELLAMINEVMARKEDLFGKAIRFNQREDGWKEVEKAVNAHSYHERREVPEIRKKFYDMRHRVRKKATQLTKSGSGGESNKTVHFKPAEAAMLPLIDQFNSPDDEPEGVSDTEEVTFNDSNDSSKMMVVIGDGGESISIYDPSNRKDTSTAPNSDPQSERGIKREFSIMDTPLNQIGDCTSTQSVSKLMTPSEINLNKNPDLDFFISILPDMVDLNASQKRRFKQKVLEILDDICNEGN